MGYYCEAEAVCPTPFREWRRAAAVAVGDGGGQAEALEPEGEQR